MFENRILCAYYCDVNNQVQVNARLPESILTERLIIKRHRREDAEEIFYSYASKPEATRYVVWNAHQTIEDTRGYLRQVIAAWNTGTGFAYTVRLHRPYRLVGSIGFVPDHDHWQVGYILSPAVWGHGLATEMLLAMMQSAAIQAFGGLKSFVHPDNTPSIRVLEKAGFRLSGKVREGVIFPNLGPEPCPCLEFRYGSARFD